MKQLFVTGVFLFMFINLSFSQDKPAYQLFNQKGKITKYNKMIRDLVKSDMVFFGEYHTNPISHWLQIEIAKSFYEKKGAKLFFGAEMFENGNQLVLDEYLAGFYDEKKLHNYGAIIKQITNLWWSLLKKRNYVLLQQIFQEDMRQ